MSDDKNTDRDFWMIMGLWLFLFAADEDRANVRAEELCGDGGFDDGEDLEDDENCELDHDDDADW